MQGVLIDTDIAIDFLRGVVSAHHFISGLWANNQAVLSVLTVYELTAGMKESEKVVTHNFIEACAVEPLSTEISCRGGDLYRKYRAKGITLTSLDCLIAATAIEKGYKVATRNVEHYPEQGLLIKL